MVRVKDRIVHDDGSRKTYDRLYKEVYSKVRPSVTNVFHALAEVRGGDASGPIGES